MRILIVGAGAIGGYFGARLRAAGRDVTFLVRPRRAAQLAADGLVVHSTKGDVMIERPVTTSADDVARAFDLVLVACKATDLGSAVESLAPAVGPSTTILPLLNGIAHLDLLGQRFGADKVLGGQCAISATVDDQGHVRHLNDLSVLTFGEQSGGPSPRLARIATELAADGIDGGPSESILPEMWEKWMFIATAAASNCLMRGSVGDIVAAGGSGVVLGLLDEIVGIASAEGFAPRAPAVERARRLLTLPASPFVASMLRDVEAGRPTEADHVLGDLLARAGRTGEKAPMLQLAYTHLKTYEARRAAR